MRGSRQHLTLDQNTVECIIKRLNLDPDQVRTSDGQRAFRAATFELCAHIRRKQQSRSAYSISKRLKLSHYIVRAVNRFPGPSSSELEAETTNVEELETVASEDETGEAPGPEQTGLTPEQVYAVLERISITPFLRSSWFVLMTQPQESKTTAPKSDFVPTPRFYEVLFRLFPDATPNELEELVETMIPELYAEILKMEKRQNAAKGQ